MNLALGAKLIWSLLSNSNEWWKKEFIGKYFHKNIFLKPENESREGHGTKIWKLCKTTIPFMLDQLGWQPGNGKRIHLQKDRTLLASLASMNQGVRDLEIQMEERELIHLTDIPIWDDNEMWSGWCCPTFPPHLYQYLQDLIKSLKGYTPVSSHRLGRHVQMGGKKSHYIVKEGYNHLLKNLPSPPHSRLWGKIWNKDGHPKINTLCWDMVQRKILTVKNLKKQKIQGPSHYVLYSKAKEEINHVFCQCSFNLEVWIIALQLLAQVQNIPSCWL